MDELNKVLEKTVTLKTMLKNKERIEKVAQYIVNHYEDYVDRWAQSLRGCCGQRSMHYTKRTG